MSQGNQNQQDELITLGTDDTGERYGIYTSDRVHMATVGLPGTGKSTLLLHLILQNIRKGEGVMVLDPHGDLISKLLTHLPRECWDKVVYIDPMTAFKYGRVVQLNFLEYKNALERDLVARSLMDSLAKIYSKFWGPRLDMIMMNGIYALLEAGTPTIGDVYRVIADEDFREGILARVRDAKVRSFWESEFRSMPRDASASVLTKIYRIVQEKILQPMFECQKSSVDFREMIDTGKIVVINLMEGQLTSDLVNFLGSLILARVYLAGMSRTNIPESQRVPFYVYVDEAPRFVTSSVSDMLQALRKYHVYTTLASQHLEQYREDVADSIPALCGALIVFATGKETAKKIEGFFLPVITADDIQHLPQFWFAISTMVKGVREAITLKCIDEGFGPEDPETIIKYSLEHFGRQVQVEQEMRGEETKVALSEYPEPSPIMWLTMLKIKVEGKMEKDDIDRILSRNWGFNTPDTTEAVSTLSLKSYLLVTKQVKKMDEKMQLPDGATKYHQIKKTIYSYSVSPLAIKLFFTDVPASPRAGGDEHLAILATILSDMRSAGNFCFIDLGAEGVKKKPDVLVYPLSKKTDESGRVRVNPRMWDTPHVFAIEVETNPMSYKERLIGNWTKCKNLGLPVIFAVRSYEVKLQTEEYLRSQGVPIVPNILEQYAPGNALVIFVEQGMRVALGELFEQDQITAERPSETYQKAPEEVTTEIIEEAKPEAEINPVELKIKEVLDQGYRLVLKTVQNKLYLTARKGDEVRSLGRMTPELEKIARKYGVPIPPALETKNE